MNLGAKLKKIREQNRYSQKEIADILNISQKTYSNIESGKSQINLETLAILSKLFDFDAIKLLEENEIFLNYKTFNHNKKEKYNYRLIYNSLLKRNENLIEELTEVNSIIKNVLDSLNT